MEKERIHLYMYHIHFKIRWKPELIEIMSSTVWQTMFHKIAAYYMSPHVMVVKILGASLVWLLRHQARIMCSSSAIGMKTNWVTWTSHSVSSHDVRFR